MSEDNTVMTQLKRLAEMEGFKEETPGFERRIRQLQVVKCREIKGVSACTECQVFDYCEIAKQVMRDRRGIKD